MLFRKLNQEFELKNEKNRDIKTGTYGFGSVSVFEKKSGYGSVTVRLRFSQSQKLRLRFGFGLHEKWPENRVFGFGSVNRSFPTQ